MLSEMAKLGDEYELAYEPVAEWEDWPLGDGRRHNFLREYYAERSAVSFRRLQSHVLLTLLSRYKQNEEKIKPVVYERSVRVARCVFLAMERDLVEAEDLCFLEGLARHTEEAYERNALSVYLTCSDKDMLHRVAARARASESNLS